MKKKILTVLFILVTVLILSANTIAPCDDMYTDPDHSGTNPVITELWTADFNPSGHFERIMINFDLSSYIGQTAESAVLHLTRFFSCPSSGTTASTFYAITEEWTEETWNHTQNIQYNSSINMPYVFSGNGGNAIVQFEVDVTDFINTLLESSFENNGFVIKANSNQKFSKFYSKEYSNADYRPSLEITFSGSDADEDVVSKNIKFLNNYPNPFNPTTTISFETTKSASLCNASAQQAKLEIYNIKGQKVKTFDVTLSPSSSLRTSSVEGSVVWNGTDENNQPVSSGTYFYNLNVDGEIVASEKMILLK